MARRDLKLLKSLLLCVFLAGIPEAALSQRDYCGGRHIDLSTALCCNRLVYVRSGFLPACCGRVGYDRKFYMCCQGSLRRRQGKQPHCCGNNVIDEFRETCPQDQPSRGLVRPSRVHEGRNVDTGGLIALSEVAKKIEGFDVSCCHLTTASSKARCCGEVYNKIGIHPQCCRHESVVDAFPSPAQIHRMARGHELIMNEQFEATLSPPRITAGVPEQRALCCRYRGLLRRLCCEQGSPGRRHSSSCCGPQHMARTDHRSQLSATTLPECCHSSSRPVCCYKRSTWLGCCAQERRATGGIATPVRNTRHRTQLTTTHPLRIARPGWERTPCCNMRHNAAAVRYCCEAGYLRTGQFLPCCPSAEFQTTSTRDGHRVRTTSATRTERGTSIYHTRPTTTPSRESATEESVNGHLTGASTSTRPVYMYTAAKETSDVDRSDVYGERRPTGLNQTSTPDSVMSVSTDFTTTRAGRHDPSQTRPTHTPVMYQELGSADDDGDDDDDDDDLHSATPDNELHSQPPNSGAVTSSEESFTNGLEFASMEEVNIDEPAANRMTAPVVDEENRGTEEISALSENVPHDIGFCGGMPYDRRKGMCCIDTIRRKIGAFPLCCERKAYDAILFKCCHGNRILRSCNEDYVPVRSSWGVFV